MLRSRSPLPLLILSTVFAMPASAAQPSIKTRMQAVAILDILGGKPVPRVLRTVLSAPIAREDTSFSITERDGISQTVRARVYLPRGKPHAPAIVLLHGVHHLGIDEPRLTAFAAAMASCGIRVLTPELPDIKDYHVDARSLRMIGQSATWFSKQTGGPVGVVGLSFTGGLALVAASEPEYRQSFKFVLAVGSQDSMERVAEFYRTGQDPKPDGSIESVKPHEYGALVLEYKYLDNFVPVADVAAIRPVLRAHLYEDRDAERFAMEALSPTQRGEAKDVMDTTSAKTHALIATSNASHANELAALSPHGRLATLDVPVYLLHGEGDNIIPAAETLWMETELPKSTLKAALVSPVISHIDFDGKGPTSADKWRLVNFFALVLQAAERRH